MDRVRMGMLLVLGGGLMVLSALALAALHAGGINRFVLIHALHALVYLAAVATVSGVFPRSVATVHGTKAPTPTGKESDADAPDSSRTFVLILAVAVIIRLIALAAPPTLTTDAYRYVWDGRVQAAGINPYLHIPAAPELAHLRDAAIYPNINRADTHPTIYPPIAQMLFLAGTRIVDGIRGLQLLMLMIDLVTIWAISRWLAACGRSRSWVLVYAWHPLPLWEFAGMAHIDAAGVMFLSLALLAGQTGRQGLAGAAFAAAGLVKYQYVLLVPVIWRRWGWRLPLVLVLVALAAALPYASAGPKLLGSLFAHLDEEGYRDGYGFYLLGLLKSFGLPHPSARWFAALAALTLTGLGAAIAMRRASQVIAPEHALWLIAAFLLLVSPHYPWYYAMVLPILCGRLCVPLLWMTLTVSGLYLEASDGLLEPYTRFKVLTVVLGGAAIFSLLPARREAARP